MKSYIENYQKNGYCIVNFKKDLIKSFKILQNDMLEMGFTLELPHRLSSSDKVESDELVIHTEGVFEKLPTALIVFCEDINCKGGNTNIYSSELTAKSILLDYPYLRNLVIEYYDPRDLSIKNSYNLINENNQLIFREFVKHQKIINLPIEWESSEIELYNYISQCIRKNIVYSHKWSTGDILIFNNYRCLHGRDSYHGKRVMHRIICDK